MWTIVHTSNKLMRHVLNKTRSVNRFKGGRTQTENMMNPQFVKTRSYASVPHLFRPRVFMLHHVVKHTTVHGCKHLANLI